MNPQGSGVTPQQLLPPQAVAAAVRRGSSPNGLFQQAPLSAGMTPGAPGYDPSMQTPPQPGTQQTNPMNPSMPGQPTGMPPQAGMGDATPPMDESTMILQALQDRLEHHSKITEKTVSTLAKMVEAGIPTPDQQGQQNAPTA